MNRMHLRKYKNKKNKVINKIIFILILLFICIFYIFKIFNKKALPQLLEYSEIETTKIVSSIVTNTIIEEIANNITMEDLFITTKDSNGDIKSIDFNSSEVNKLLSKAAKSVEQNLRYIESGNTDKLNLTNYVSNLDKEKIKKGIIYELPSGIIFNNILFNNILPKIPIKISLIGTVFSQLSTDVKSYGINNALIQVNLNIESEVKILLPFVSSRTKIQESIPIIMKVIEGNVPSYYFDGYLDSITNQ
ncbi:MAG: sporulation protein YunB [Bacilli bacterium]|nr:sporulation protein YunB [Bacilli bacterium]